MFEFYQNGVWVNYTTVSGGRAQESEIVFPQVVEKGADSYRSVEYGKLVSVVVAAVQELYKKVMGITAEVETLRLENQKLKLENESIKTRLQKIEKALDIK